jgi:hypothetical protein
MMWVVAILALFSFKPAMAHEWYSELRVPGSMQICCGKKDCAPYPHRMNDSETAFELFVRGKWRQVPDDVILHDHSSPDGQVHACCWNGVGQGGCEAEEPVVFRCVVPLGRGV